MKIKNILILAILAGSFCACSDLINPSVQNAQSAEQMFEDAASAQGILGYGYANLPFETKSTTDIATDDAVTNDLGSGYRSMAQGTWAANNDPMSQWQARRITIQYMLGSFSRADRGIGGVRPVAPPTWLVSNFLVRPASS